MTPFPNPFINVQKKMPRWKLFLLRSSFLPCLSLPFISVENILKMIWEYFGILWKYFEIFWKYFKNILKISMDNKQRFVVRLEIIRDRDNRNHYYYYNILIIQKQLAINIICSIGWRLTIWNCIWYTIFAYLMHFHVQLNKSCLNNNSQTCIKISMNNDYCWAQVTFFYSCSLYGPPYHIYIIYVLAYPSDIIKHFHDGIKCS